MITLKPNANNTVNTLCHKDAVIAYYYSICENYANNHIQLFITDLQTLITKVGMIMSEVSTRHVYISYCRKAIDYLCDTVLDDPRLKVKFNNLGINDKGNKGKHSLITNTLNLDTAAAVFNEMIIAISNKYHLPAIKTLLIEKKKKEKSGINNTLNAYQEYYRNLYNRPIETHHASSSSPNRTEKEKAKHNEASVEDEAGASMRITLSMGKGYYTKGIFKKVKMLNLLLYVDCYTGDYKLKSLKATIKCGSNIITKKVPASTEYRDSRELVLDLDASLFKGKITATVVGIYKIGLFKTKEIRKSVWDTF